MRILLITMSVMGLLMATVGVAEATCTMPPKASKPPSGNSASKVEIMSAIKELKALDDATQGFYDCLNTEATDAGEADNKRSVARREKAMTKAEARLFKAQDAVNKEIRAYKQRMAKKKEAS